MAIAGPGINGKLNDCLPDIDKAGLDIPLLQHVGHGEGATSLHRCLVHSLRPLLVRPVVRHGPIIAEGRVHDILALHVAAGFGVAEAAVDEGAVVAQGAHEHAGVDVVVVVLGDSPVVLLSIVDDEMDVVGDAGGLDGGEVGGFDDGVRIGVCHLHRPGAGACANVEDMGGIAEGSCVQDAAQGMVDHAVEVVETLGFAGVVGVVVDCGGS